MNSKTRILEKLTRHIEERSPVTHFMIFKLEGNDDLFKAAVELGKSGVLSMVIECGVAYLQYRKEGGFNVKA